jgi:prepilin-type N-terminal cleavage/methylation domain-containing protein
MSRTQRRIPQGTVRGRHGFTIVELLIALIIIGVLSAILVPTLLHRAEDSRHTAAIADMAVIADAEDRVATDTGYYVRLFALDDLPRGDGVGMTRPTNVLDRMDGLPDEGTHAVFNLAFNTNVNSIFIRIASESPAPGGPSVVPAGSATAIFSGTLGVDVGTLAPDPYFAPNWSGPYYAIKRQSADPDDAVDVASGALRIHLRDIPCDPWGNNYVLFFRNGYVREPDGIVWPTMVNANDCLGMFDRPTIVSFGPDGKPGNNGVPDVNGRTAGTGDDLVYSFGY